LGLTKPYSFELAKKIANKGYMKKKMFENGIPTSRYIYLEKDVILDNFKLKFPVMVKPADSCASSGVKKANSVEQTQKYLHDAIKISRSGLAIVEEFMSGIEVSVYCFVCSDEVKILSTAQRFSVIDGEKQVIKCYAALSPVDISKLVKEKLKNTILKIVDVFKLKNTPLLVQMIIDGDDVYVIEFTPRVSGGSNFNAIKMGTGFDILEAAIDSYLEIPVIQDIKESKEIIIIHLIYAEPGVLHHVEGVDSLLEQGVIEKFHYHKTKGMIVTDDHASGGRVAEFIIKAKDRAEAMLKVRIAIEHLEVYDTDGKRIMRKGLFLS